jgi:hypothetical protein
MSVLSKQPRSVTELFAASFELYTESFTKIVGYILIIVVSNHLLGIFAADSIVADSTLNPDAEMDALWQAMPSLLAIFLVSFLLSCVCYAAALYRLDNVVHGREDDFFDILVLPLKKLPTLILAGFLYMLAVTIGSFLLVIPGIILMVSLVFYGYFILLEDKGAFDALSSSHSLVWDDWWRTVLMFFVPSVIFLMVFFIFGFVAGLIVAPNPNAMNIVSELLGAVVVPYFYALVYLQYHDLKLRKNM